MASVWCLPVVKLERGATGIRLMESVDDSSDHIAREILNVTPAFIGFVFSQMTDEKKIKQIVLHHNAV